MKYLKTINELKAKTYLSAADKAKLYGHSGLEKKFREKGDKKAELERLENIERIINNIKANINVFTFYDLKSEKKYKFYCDFEEMETNIESPTTHIKIPVYGTDKWKEYEMNILYYVSGSNLNKTVNILSKKDKSQTIKFAMSKKDIIKLQRGIAENVDNNIKAVDKDKEELEPTSKDYIQSVDFIKHPTFRRVFTLYNPNKVYLNHSKEMMDLKGYNGKFLVPKELDYEGLAKLFLKDKELVSGVINAYNSDENLWDQVVETDVEKKFDHIKEDFAHWIFTDQLKVPYHPGGVYYEDGSEMEEGWFEAGGIIFMWESGYSDEELDKFYKAANYIGEQAIENYIPMKKLEEYSNTNDRFIPKNLNFVKLANDFVQPDEQNVFLEEVIRTYRERTNFDDMEDSFGSWIFKEYLKLEPNYYDGWGVIFITENYPHQEDDWEEAYSLIQSYIEEQEAN